MKYYSKTLTLLSQGFYKLSFSFFKKLNSFRSISFLFLLCLSASLIFAITCFLPRIRAQRRKISKSSLAIISFICFIRCLLCFKRIINQASKNFIKEQFNIHFLKRFWQIDLHFIFLLC